LIRKEVSMNRWWSGLIHALSALWLFNSASVFAADEYPSKPIHIIVPYTAGSTADLRTRQVAQHLAERFAKSVIVENKPGASGILGTRLVAKAPPDGYTLTFMNNSMGAVATHLYKNLGFDVSKDFAPIALMAYGAAILVVSPTVPANSVKELVALAKSKPDSLTYGSSGIGSAQHLPTEMFRRMAGIEILHVPFKGDSEILTSLLGGQVSMSFAAATGFLPYIKAGKLKALAVGGTRQLAVLPNVPTMAEAGYPAFEWHNWFGFLAPRGTPQTVIARLNKEMISFLSLPHIRQEFLEAGYEIAAGSPEDLAALIKKDTARYGELIGKLGIEPE
jgi:tripartite-type tricarboxylate transporter receptor subunit TctC